MEKITHKDALNRASDRTSDIVQGVDRHPLQSYRLRLATVFLMQAPIMLRANNDNAEHMVTGKDSEQ